MWRHLGRMKIIGILLLMTWGPGAAQQDGQEKTPNYYPLQAGNQWRFRVTFGENSDKAVARITKIETIGGQSLARLEESVKSRVVAVGHLRQTEKGVFRYRMNDMEISPPMCLLQYPVKAGARWEGDITVGDSKSKYACEAMQDTVEVPAGKFQAVRVTVRIQDKVLPVTITYWFAQDVGIVKQTVEAEKRSIVTELEKFEPKK
jgi:hypothetical protein